MVAKDESGFGDCNGNKDYTTTNKRKHMGCSGWKLREQQ
jgi:hypothetical protein